MSVEKKPRWVPKVGERIRAYGGYNTVGDGRLCGGSWGVHGRITAVIDAFTIQFRCIEDGCEYSAHIKQCRRPKPKEKPKAPREWTIFLCCRQNTVAPGDRRLEGKCPSCTEAVLVREVVEPEFCDVSGVKLGRAKP